MDELDPKEIGRRMERAREAAGLSQTALARLLGTDQSTYSKWELGKKTQSVQTLGRVANALGISVAQLVSDGYVSEQGEIDAARRLTIKLTMSWRDGQYADEAQLAQAAREIAEKAYGTLGQTYVEGWLAGSGLLPTVPEYDPQPQSGTAAHTARRPADS